MPDRSSEQSPSRPLSAPRLAALAALAILTHQLSAGTATLIFGSPETGLALAVHALHAPLALASMLGGVLFPVSALVASAAWAALRSRLSAWVGSGLPGSGLAPTPTAPDFTPSLDRDLDFFSSTDFEDLLVFSLDALELLWQDVNLLVELCGENALGLGFLGVA